uniref:Uncharacterized protein n=1 Tax=Cucumis melo TaxID=3656 RepID=A0A9I9D902_CUCME
MVINRRRKKTKTYSGKFYLVKHAEKPIWKRQPLETRQKLWPQTRPHRSKPRP